MYFSMRAHPENDLTNDSLTIELPIRAHFAGSSMQVNPPVDSLNVFVPTTMGTDSTCAWNEYAVRLGVATGTTWLFAGHVGRHLNFGNAYYSQVATYPSFRWRVAGQYLVGTTPKLVWYKLYIYCYKEV
jgi:hypothetical protein